MELRSGHFLYDDKRWTIIEPDQVKMGDHLRCSTGTWGQKYLLMPGYEDCNATYIGKVVHLGDDMHDIRLLLEDGTQHSAIEYVGNSGWNTIEKYV